MRGHASNEAADRLAIKGLLSGQRRSSPVHRRFFRSQSNVDEVDLLRPFRLSKQSLLPALVGASASPTNSSTEGVPSWVFKRRDADCRSQIRAAVDTARRRGRPHVLPHFGRVASSSAGQGTHHGWSYPVLRMSRARQHARRSRDAGMVAPLRGAHRERMSRLFAIGGAQRCRCAGWVDCVAGHRRPDRGLGGHSWRGFPYGASGMGPMFASDDVRPAQRSGPARRNVCVPELGGTGLISSLFVGSGLPL